MGNIDFLKNVIFTISIDEPETKQKNGGDDLLESAKQLKAVFDSLIKAGFTEPQAMMIMSIVMNKGGKQN